MRIRDIAKMLYVQEEAVRDVSQSLGKPEKAGQQTRSQVRLHIVRVRRPIMIEIQAKTINWILLFLFSRKMAVMDIEKYLSRLFCMKKSLRNSKMQFQEKRRKR